MYLFEINGGNNNRTSVRFVSQYTTRKASSFSCYSINVKKAQTWW